MSSLNVCDPKASLFPQSKSEICKSCNKTLAKHIVFSTLLVIINSSSTTLVSANTIKIDMLSDPSDYLIFFTTKSEKQKERWLQATPAGLRCLRQQYMFSHARKIEMSQSFPSQFLTDYNLEQGKKCLTVAPSVWIITRHDIK